MPFVLSPLDQGNKTGSMKVLVTGTAGFIGFHLARTLLDQGHQVLGLDNFNGYYAPVLKRRRHALLEGRPGYQGHEADITDYAFMRELAAREKPDVFCHLAAQAGVRHSLSKPFDYQRSNLDAFLNVLETCRHEAIPRLVYASSSSVYGNSQKLPFNEEDRVDNCGRCGKCIITMAALMGCDALGEATGFPDAIPLDELRAMRPAPLQSRQHWIDVVRLLDDTGRAPEVRDAILHALRRAARPDAKGWRRILREKRAGIRPSLHPSWKDPARGIDWTHHTDTVRVMDEGWSERLGHPLPKPPEDLRPR